MTITFSELAGAQLVELDVEESALEAKLLRVLNGLSKDKDFSVFTKVGAKNLNLRMKPLPDAVFQVMSAAVGA